MIVPGSANALMLGGAKDYTIARSLRFRSSASAYLSRTPASAGNRKTWTWSGWIKRGSLGTQQKIFTAGNDISGNYQFGLYWDSNNALGLYGALASADINLVSSSVYRDTSAWYHIVVALDTTQATNTNRVKIYVNGVQITSFSTSTYPAQNNEPLWNSNIVQGIFAYVASAGQSYTDGYLAEVNNIDGQALTPSSFGEYDLTTGVWKPKKYAGTYGTNGFYLPFDRQTTASYAANFNGSNQWLSGNLSSAIGTGDFTVEGWVYQNTLTNYQNWVSIERGAGGFNIGTDASGAMTFYSSAAPQISVAGIIKAGTWQHFAFVRSGTTLTAYLNGVSRGTATVSTNFSATAFYIGALNNIPQEILNASLSNVRITGTAVYTSNFTPSTAPLTAVTGTRLLTLQSSTIVDNSGNGISLTNNNAVSTVVSNPFLGLNIASDQSGNGNNWTPNNISLTAGATYDSMTDVPTLTSKDAANFATLNPLTNTATGISEANLQVTTGTAGWAGAKASIIIPSSGKYYFEGYVNATTGSVGFNIGLADPQVGVAQATGYGIYGTTQIASFNNGATVILSGQSFTTGDIIQVAADTDNGKIWIGRNNVWYDASLGTTGNPSTNTNATIPSNPAGLNPYLTVYNGGARINFGQRPFAYTPPTGFVALNTFNLPEPGIKDGKKHFDATTYTGTSANQTVVNSGGFQPDFAWIKSRSAATDHYLFDVIRGGSALLSNSTIAENNYATFAGFTSSGFTVSNAGGARTGTNTNGATYIGWQWKANGAGVSNTAGSISATVSANPSAGFSVVTYTGTGSNATVGHGLGVAPAMIITKGRSVTGAMVGNWFVYHKNMSASPATGLLKFNATDAFATAANVWNNTAPTSSVFSLSTNTDNNNNGTGFVAYCFAEVAGYSKFGSYVGNGSADGTFVHTGFRPRFVMIKRTDAADVWVTFDTVRNSANLTNSRLFPNLSNAEISDADNAIDVLSNGFKVRSPNAPLNANGGNYIYMAFAENPFKYSLAR